MPTRLRKTALRLKLWLRDRDNLLFVSMILLHLIPIWSFEYFPSQDGPVHVENANIIRQYFFSDNEIFRKFYEFNQNVVPNWIGHFIMAVFMFVVSPLVAEKILLTGYIILFPVSVRYALLAIRPDAGFIAVLAFPFIYNYLLHMGFYNFSYSLAMFFFAVGYWLKHREKFGLRETSILMTLGLLLYFSHPISLVTALSAIAVFAVWLTFLDFIRQTRRRHLDIPTLRNAVRTRGLLPLYAFLPALILTVIFLAENGMKKLRTPVLNDNWEPRLIRLSQLDSLVSYGSVERWFSTALVWLFLAAAVYLLVTKALRRRVNCWDGLLLVVLLYICVYFTVPDSMSGGGFIGRRMSLFPFLAVILWFGAQSYDRWAKRGIQLATVAISLILLGLHTTSYAKLNDYIKEYLSGMSLIEPGATLMPLCFAPRGRGLSSRVGVFLHASGYIAAERQVVEFGNYEARSELFPMMFRPYADSPYLFPSNHVGIARKTKRLKRKLPDAVLLKYPELMVEEVDYVLVWGARKNRRGRQYFRRLRENYTLIYTSPQRGLMQLYRRKTLGN